VGRMHTAIQIASGYTLWAYCFESLNSIVRISRPFEQASVVSISEWKQLQPRNRVFFTLVLVPVASSRGSY